MSRDEFDIIRRFFTRATKDRDVLLGIGDDAAVIRPDGPLAVATDTLVAGVHFPYNMPPDAVGYRSLAVNLSDLAAMGAQPRWCTLALTVSEAEADDAWLAAFANAFLELAERYGVSLVGGDLTRGPLNASVHLLGQVDPARLLTRGGGRVGDDVYVTGSLGDSAAGLALFTEGVGDAGPDHSALSARFLKPTPRVDEGRALGPLASAAIDISDGLVADLGHLCRASGCGAVIDVERIPLSAELLALFPPQAARGYALGGGDDYELCFTAPPAQARAIERVMGELGTSARCIGQLVRGEAVSCCRDGRPFTPPVSGYKHFS